MIICTRCEGTGFLNFNQFASLPCGMPPEYDAEYDTEIILCMIKDLDLAGIEHDIQVCDCCGDGDSWYDIPGEHYNAEDPIGHRGPYAYNGGRCECH